MNSEAHRWSGRRLKRKVLELLQQEDFAAGLETLRSLPARQVVNPLFSFLCHGDSLVKWRAVTAMGVVVAELARKDMESARVIMRRMIWQLNDESGGIGWGIPEAMGEIMARQQGLAREYCHMLVSYMQEHGNFLEHIPLQRGVIWGLARVAQRRPQCLQAAAHDAAAFLSSEDASLRGLSAWLLGILGAEESLASLQGLLGDDSEIFLYQEGRQKLFRVKELAQEALTAIAARRAGEQG
ncbi:MAG: HEAT repeat domain-containing protein [Deltaproteobacteria bacterium]|nr:HEAT repeat domain-containing protein [Deltaproteobacteria bacterium]